MARQVGLGRALEIILGARDFDADEAEAYGTVNRALDPEEIGPFVRALAERIALTTISNGRLIFSLQVIRKASDSRMVRTTCAS